MERLTVPDEEIDGGTRRAVIDARAVREEAMKIYWALKKYEDTGLSPEGIVDGKLLTGWIPVSEWLPEEPSQGKLPEYIVTIRGASEATTLIYAGDGYWWDPIEGERYAVSAWMPMPEAYKTKI